MLVTRVTQRDLEKAAKAARVGLLELRTVRGRRNAFRFRLVPLAGVTLWTRYSASAFPKKDGTRRRVHAVCWHGQRAFMRALYARVPDARIATSFTTYKNIEHFEDTHTDTLSRQVGAPIAPIAYGELCKHGYGRAEGSEPDTAKLDAKYFATLYAREIVTHCAQSVTP